MAGGGRRSARRGLLLWAAGLPLGMMGTACAAGPALAWRDLGGFWLPLPADMVQQAGGIDSRAGHLTGGGLRIDYDLGIYSDPLAPRSEALDRQQTAVVVDGLPAMLVRWRSAQPVPGRHFIGLHLPQISQTSMGPLRLTLLAYGSEARIVEQAQPWLLALKLSAPTGPPRP